MLKYLKKKRFQASKKEEPFLRPAWQVLMFLKLNEIKRKKRELNFDDIVLIGKKNLKISSVISWYWKRIDDILALELVKLRKDICDMKFGGYFFLENQVIFFIQEKKNF